MEYYIMKRYQKAKREASDVEPGFSRFSNGQKVTVIICLVLVVASGVGLAILSQLRVSFWWCVLCVLVFAIAIIVFLIIVSKDEKQHFEKYENGKHKKLLLLYKILQENYGVYSEEKVKELIIKYQNYVEKKEEEEKQRNKIMLTLLSGFSVVATLTIENIEKIGMGIDFWLTCIVIAAFLFAGFGLYIYSAKCFETLKKQYEVMVNDLQDLLLYISNEHLENTWLFRVAECYKSEANIYKVLFKTIEEQEDILKLDFATIEGKNIYYLITPQQGNNRWLNVKRQIIEQVECAIREKKFFFVDEALLKECIISKGLYRVVRSI